MELRYITITTNRTRFNTGFLVCLITCFRAPHGALGGNLTFRQPLRIAVKPLQVSMSDASHDIPEAAILPHRIPQSSEVEVHLIAPLETPDDGKRTCNNCEFLF